MLQPGREVDDGVKCWQVAEERRLRFEIKCQRPEMIANHMKNTMGNGKVINTRVGKALL